jgi:flagellar basal-body rod protein FlgB
MFIDRLLNQGNAPLLEQTLRFTEARQRLLSENVANVDTPGYEQKDLDVGKFQSMLSERVEQRDEAPPGSMGFSDINAEVENPHSTLLYHDRNNRSMEQLMSDNARNALFHNMIVELLRKQYGAMEMALKERVT